MTKLLVAIALTATACQAHNKTLERKVDDLAAQLATTQRVISEIRDRLEQRRTTPAPRAEGTNLDRKIDELDKKLAAVIASSQQPTYRPPRRPEPDRGKVYALTVDGHPSDGPADAKVTLVLAYDYADPFTDRSRSTLVELRKKYGNDLRIVYRSFVVHPRIATAAALASCAADKQKKFAAYDNLLWEKGFKERRYDQDVEVQDQPAQHCWDVAQGCPITLGFARALKLDLARFKTDMQSCQSELKADMVDLQGFGVGATPSFFINGRYTSGAQPAENFEVIIDEELAKANDRIKGGTAKAKYYKEWVLAKGLTKLESTP